MPPEPWFPPSTDWRFAFVSLFVAYTAFHVALICVFKLGKRGWKIVDYFWLAFASLALLGASGQARKSVAAEHMRGEEILTSRYYDDVLRYARDYGRGGIACREFVRSEWSPAPRQFVESQQEYDSACSWFKKVEAMLPKRSIGVLSISSLPPKPAVSGDLSSIFRAFDDQITLFNSAEQRRARVQEAARTSALEKGLTLLTPWLTALALGLRLAKVTGELHLDQRVDDGIGSTKSQRYK